MGLYEGIKDVAKVIQQADNIDLYKRLLDLGSQALDMQAEIAKLKEENEILKRRHDLTTKVQRHQGTYITLSDDSQSIRYCSNCWDCEQKLIQLNTRDYGTFFCPHCKNKDIYDEADRSPRPVGVI